MRVAVIGGTGFVGAYLVDALLAFGHEPALLVRAGSESRVDRRAQCRIVTGDVRDAAGIADLLTGADALIYAVGILREDPSTGATFEELQFRGVERSIAAANNAGTRRFLLLSANGVRPSGTPYERSKYQAVEALARSSLEYTIFGPSVIFGNPRGRDEIASRLYRQMIRPPLPAVYFHTGWRPRAATVLLSPVHAADVADAIAGSLDDPAASGRTFRLGGPEALTWKEIVQRIARATGRRKLILPMPVGLMYLAASVFDRWPRFPVTRDQLRMLAAGNVVDAGGLRDLLARELRRFAGDELAYLTRDS
jgi:NADH dehydrogenase